MDVRVLPAMFVPRDPPLASADWAVMGHLIPLEKTHSGSLLGIWSRARCQVVSAGWHTEDVTTVSLRSHVQLVNLEKQREAWRKGERATTHAEEQ